LTLIGGPTLLIEIGGLRLLPTRHSTCPATTVGSVTAQIDRTTLPPRYRSDRCSSPQPNQHFGNLDLPWRAFTEAEATLTTPVGQIVSAATHAACTWERPRFRAGRPVGNRVGSPGATAPSGSSQSPAT
jgi:hypothetical protein